MDIRVESTPNPNALKFVVGRPTTEGRPRSYRRPEDADDDLSRTLFQIPGVTGLLFLADFVTVNKSPDAEWETIEPAVTETIRRTLGGHEAV